MVAVGIFSPVYLGPCSVFTRKPSLKKLDQCCVMAMTKEHKLFWIPGFQELNLIAMVRNKINTARIYHMLQYYKLETIVSEIRYDTAV